MLLYLFFSASFWLATYARHIDLDKPQVLEDREAPCIALNDCPGAPKPQPISSTTTSSPPPPSSVSPTVTATTSTISGDVTAQAPIQRLYLDKETCRDQKKIINQAWLDASLLAKAQTGGKINYDYTIPKAQWFGKDYNWGGWWPISSNYRKIIGDNTGRQAKLYGSDAPGHVYLYFSCPKQHKECSAGTIAASADSNGFFWTNHYTILCPLFFKRPTLSKVLSDVRWSTQQKMIMDNYWGNQGYSILHETYHYKTTVSQPRTADYCYKAKDCWEMAANPKKGTSWAMVTADSYALYAMAVYAQQYWNTPHPPIPVQYSSALMQTNNATIFNSTLFQEAANPSNSTPPLVPDSTDSAPAQPTAYYKALDSVPQDLFGTTNDVNSASQNVNPRWELMDGPGFDTSSVSNSSPTSAPSSTASPSPSSTPDTSSPAYKSCENALGSSNCHKKDIPCLQNQCRGNADCQACNYSCDTVGG